jgi:hypothetical protein
MAAILPLLLILPDASALRPTGPAETLRLPPSCSEPLAMKLRTAASVLSTIRKSVTSAPTLKPPPRPPMPRAAGADQRSSGSRAITRPEPARADMTTEPAE